MHLIKTGFIRSGLAVLLLMCIAFLNLGNGVLTSAAGESEEWTCPSCGQTGNTRKFCRNCGNQKPEESMPTPSPTPATTVGIDKSQTYEAALNLAANDLTDLKGLRDAISMLKQTGTYSYSKSYLMYFQAICESQQDDDLNAARLRLVNCSKQSGFVTDLQNRKLPSCEELIRYVDARILESRGLINDAYAAFVDLEVLDSPDRAFNIGLLVEEEPTPALTKRARELNVGDYVTFGTYPQTETGNDKTPIEWIVLDVQDGKALLLSKYGLDTQYYNDKYVDITWESCSLRSWLNDYFVSHAFSTGEIAAISLTSVDNSNNQGYWETDGGKNTQDRVFLLSYSEVNRYFGVVGTEEFGHSFSDLRDDNGYILSRMVVTPYVKQKGAFCEERDTADGTRLVGNWWLRSPGYHQNYAARIYVYGYLDAFYVNESLAEPTIWGDDPPGVCVRPAMWVSLDSGIF